jgi:hypothetical protein
MTKSFKMVLLEAFQELGGWSSSPTFSALAEQSWQVLQRRRPLLSDLPDNDAQKQQVHPQPGWLAYWKNNPINAWTGGNLADQQPRLLSGRQRASATQLQCPGTTTRQLRRAGSGIGGLSPCGL